MAATIPREGREYITWTVTGAPDNTHLEVSLDGGTAWHPLTRDGDQFRALIAGPDAGDNPDGTIVHPGGTVRPLIRLRDATEIVIRPGDYLTVK